MGDATASLVSESLSSTTAGTAVGPCKAVNVSLSGTWVGTVTLQRYYGGGWKDVATWTGNVETIVTVSTRKARARLNFTRTSGTVVTVIEADDGKAAGGGALSAGSAAIGKVGHDMTGGGQNYKTVTTGGTPVQIASTTAAKLVIIQAYRANTGYIGVGFSNAVRASGTVGTGVGISLAAGEVLTLPIDDLADVWIDATVNGEGVRYTYVS